MMNISSVSSSSATDYVRKLGSAETTSSSSQVDNESGSDQVKLSKPAEMMKKLAALKESDPAKFQEVVSNIANKLDEAAQSATGEEQARLSDLASKFSQAAESGDLSSLQPPEGGGGRGQGGPHGPRSAGGPPPPPPPDATSESDEDTDDASTSASATSSTTSASSPSSTNLRAMASYKKHERDGADSALRSVMDSAMSMIDDALSNV